MTVYRVVLAAKADAQLARLWDYLAEEAGPAVASALTDALVARCLELEIFPRRGTPRDDLRPDLRTVPFRRVATIGYVIAGRDVVIVGIAFRGQDLQAAIVEAG